MKHIEIGCRKKYDITSLFTIESETTAVMSLQSLYTMRVAH